MCTMLCAASGDSQGSGMAAHQSREVLDGLMAGPRRGLPAPTSGNQPPHLAAMNRAHFPEQDPSIRDTQHTV